MDASMRVYDLIKRKRDGEALTGEEIRYLIRAYLEGKIPEYQISALLMAIFFRGMTFRETWDLTHAMIRSGTILDLSGLPGPKIDKHSTGGVGDKASLVVAPLAAAAGIRVPMISGRGLGHTGGTLDKLGAIPGVRVDLSQKELIEQLRNCGVAMIGQTQDLAPADRRLYALRDVTATVDCIPLIAASIMSKKLAEGIGGLVLDVKVGSGAFMKTAPAATRLAREMVEIGRRARCKVVALITDMDQPLGLAVGNALEVREAVDVLSGAGPPDLRRLSLELTAWMVRIAGLEREPAKAFVTVRTLLDSGRALEKFKELVALQGGEPNAVDRPERLPRARYERPIKAPHAGRVCRIQTEAIGTAAMILGAGRERVESAVDPSAGIILMKKRGDQVDRGEVLAVMHGNDPQKFLAASDIILEAYAIGHRQMPRKPLIRAVVTAEGTRRLRIFPNPN